MARRPQARYYASRKGGGYFATIDGKLYELALGPDDAVTGPTYLAALDRFREILELGGVAQAEPQTMAELCARYELDMDPDSVPGLLERFDLRMGEPA